MGARKKKANRARLTFIFWWWGAIPRQTSVTQRLKTAANSCGKVQNPAPTADNLTSCVTWQSPTKCVRRAASSIPIYGIEPASVNACAAHSMWRTSAASGRSAQERHHAAAEVPPRSPHWLGCGVVTHGFHTFFVWRKLMTTKRCACCGQAFQPRPQAPNQTYCSLPDCQRARKRQWHHNKLQSDPDYRGNQRDAQRAWLERHPDYWRNYRDAHPEYAERNRDRQRAIQSGNTHSLAKMDVCWPPSLTPGLYRITPARGTDASSSRALVVEIAPVCVDCPCKKDACKERT